MPVLGRGLIASSEAGLSRSVQALLRVVFGYKPEIKTVNTAGGVLDGFTEKAFDLVLIDDGLFAGAGIDFLSFLAQVKAPARIIVLSRVSRPSDILAMKNTGIAAVINPAELDSARLAEAYIRSCVLTVLEDRQIASSETRKAEVVSLEPRGNYTAKSSEAPPSTEIHRSPRTAQTLQLRNKVYVSA